MYLLQIKLSHWLNLSHDMEKSLLENSPQGIFHILGKGSITLDNYIYATEMLHFFIFVSLIFPNPTSACSDGKAFIWN